MNKLEVTGTVKEILNPESGTSKAGKEWQKQEFVIETDDQYPRSVCFTLFGDKTDLISNIKLHDVVDVSFNLESREYNGRWFHNINAWRIVLTEHSEQTPSNDIPPEPEPQEGEDDLPF